MDEPNVPSQSPSRFNWPLALLALAVLAYALYFSWATVNRYAAFEARSQDLGNLNQAIWNLAHGNGLRFTNYAGITSRLSLHVEPILLPIAAIYRLYPHPELLLVLQAIVVALGAHPLFALARLKLISGWAALIFGLVFLLNPAIQGATWYEFHPVTLAPTLLMAAFYFLITGRNGWFALFAALAAFTKEEIGLLVFMMGLYALLAQHRRKMGTITMALSLGWALFAVLGVQGRFAAGNIHWGRYAYLGDSPGEIIASLFTRPGLVWGQMQSANVLRYFWLLLFPVAFTSLAALDVFLLALPSLAINLLADFSPMHQVNELIYSAPIIPFVMLSSVMGTARVQGWLASRWGRGADRRRTLAVALAVVVLAFTLVSQWRYGYLPGGGNHMSLTVTEHHRRAQAIIDQIPPDAAVSAQDRLNPHVSGRRTVYIFPDVNDADFVFLDVTGPAWPQHPSDVRKTVDDLLASGCGVAAAEDGYLLLGKDAPAIAAPDELPASFFDAWRAPIGAATADLQIDFGDQLRLLDYRVATDRYGELVTTLVWQALQPLDEDLRFYIAYLDPELKPLHESEFYPPPASLWYPTSLWTPGEPVQVTTLPWNLEEGRFALAVGVYRGENWQAGERLPASVPPEDAIAFPVLEGGTLVRLGGFEREGDGWRQLSPAPTSPGRPLDARFDDVAQLEGVTFEKNEFSPGDEVNFTLHWRGVGEAALDYSVFAHLLDEQGEKAAQLDWQPHDAISLLPMTAWSPGQLLADSQTLVLPDDLPPGRYRLIVGLYDWQSGQRLPVTGADAVDGNVVLAGELTVR
jgi:uncharacterized membrane protein